jgi:hypothetical protein
LERDVKQKYYFAVTFANWVFMLNLFKKLFTPVEKSNGSTGQPVPQMNDLNGEPLAEGDFVLSLRYELGKCQLVKLNGIWHYHSSENGQQVSWARMIDAATGFQKVTKLAD